MKTTPDMTMKQFNAALARNGMKRVPFMGYIDLGIPGHSLEIHPLYGCMRLRDQLAYLLKERDRWEKQFAENEKGAPKSCPA